MKVVSVSRKPCSEGTVAANALRWGPGGLNIDVSRITAAGPSPSIARREVSRRTGVAPITGLTHQEGVAMGKIMRQGNPEVYMAEHPGENLGRWPANLILCHKPECQRVGEKKVKASGSRPDQVGKGSGNRSNVFGQAFGVITISHTDPDGTETVAAWECEPGCPVAELDRQSGALHDRGNRSPEGTGGGMFGHGQFTRDVPLTFGDTGGASRFFKQVHKQMADTTLPQDLIEYLTNMIGAPGLPGIYWERIYDERLVEMADNSLPGLVVEGTPTEDQACELKRVLMPGAHLLLVSPESDKTGYLGTCQLEDEGFEIRDAIFLNDEPDELFYVAKAARVEREAGCQLLPARAGFEAVDREEGTAGLDSPRSGAGRTAESVHNFHPTVKPIEIMELFLRNVPTEKLVCDPFMGSGTTGIAVTKTGHDFLGIERDPEYLPIADARIRHWDHKNWGDAEIRSDHKPVEQVKSDFEDALDFLLGAD